MAKKIIKKEQVKVSVEDEKKYLEKIDELIANGMDAEDAIKEARK